MKLAVNNPNLSVILPVGCNAHCNFCYWKKSEGLTLERFSFVINSLPEIFEQISITGGEPTLASDLIHYLSIAKKRFKKVVLNTNGFNLTKEHIELCDYVNISRHHYEDAKSNAIFNSRSLPNIDGLKCFSKIKNNVTLNCFLPENFEDLIFIKNYILFAKEIGAKVAFRKYYNNLNILSKVDTDDSLIDYHSCGACLHRHHVIDGVDVTFKYSVQETSEAMNDIYELILQSNGDLTFDWGGKNILQYKEL